MRKALLLTAAAFATASAFAASPQAVSLLDSRAQESQDVQFSNKKSGFEARPLSTTSIAKSRAEETPTYITEAPEGTTYTYQVHQGGWINPWGNIGYSEYRYFNKITWCDNGEVYIYNPMPALSTGTYMKGRLQDDKVIVDLPQCIGYVDNGREDPFYIYMNKLEYRPGEEEPTEEGVDTGWFYIVAENNQVAYTIGDDGSLTLDLGMDYGWDDMEMPEFLMGVTSNCNVGSKDSWIGYGDAQEEYTNLDFMLVQLPEGVKSEQWALYYDGGARLVNVAFDGEDFYLGNIHNGVPDSWLKGTVADGEVTIPSDQFLGLYTNVNSTMMIYNKAAVPGWVRFDPNDTESEEGDYSHGYWGQIEFEKDYTLAYDPEKKTLVCTEPDLSLVINIGTERISYLVLYTNAEINYQSPEKNDAAPVNPELNNFDDWGTWGRMGWNIPVNNVLGNLLDSSKMYYNIYIDGELFTFYPDEYVRLKEEMVDVPYDFSDGNYDFISNGILHYIYFYQVGIESVGIQSFYKADDGTVYSSDLVTAVVTTGISDINANDDSTVTYIDLMGREVRNPQAGTVCIKKVTKADGTFTVAKIIIR